MVDRVIPTQGFGTHAHREFEIFSYSEVSSLVSSRRITFQLTRLACPCPAVLAGQLTHKDSLHNTEILRRGDLQMTSTGTGIRHSEFNDNKQEGVHFLQIWALPHTRGLKPGYYTRHVTDEQKRGKLVRVVAPVGAEGVKDEREGEGPAPVCHGRPIEISSARRDTDLLCLLSRRSTRGCPCPPRCSLPALQSRTPSHLPSTHPPRRPQSESTSTWSNRPGTTPVPATPTPMPPGSRSVATRVSCWAKGMGCLSMVERRGM